MRHKIVDVLLQIRARAADCMHLVLANHLRKRKTQLRGAHCPCESNQHSTAISNVFSISQRGILYNSGVKVPIMMINKFRNRSFSHAALFTPSRRKIDKTNRFFCCEYGDQKNDRVLGIVI